MVTQAEKAAAFEELHSRAGVFAIPNPWDVGSACLLEALGFECLATTSSGFAQTLGRTDGAVSLEEKFRHCSELCAATTIPISADLENCFGDSPESVASCIERFAESGVVGGSVEDFTGDENHPIYDFTLAVERVSAAVEAAAKLPFKFMLTARAENLLRSTRDIDDTIKRLQAYETAGADVLYAPLLISLNEVRLVSSSVNKPINVLGTPLHEYSVNDIGSAGAKRVSTGGGLARLVAGTLLGAGASLRDKGSLAWVADIASVADIDKLLGNGRGSEIDQTM